MEICPSSPPLIYLVKHLFISQWIPRYFFHALAYNPMLLYFIACSIFGHWESFHLAPPFLWLIPTNVGFCHCCCLCVVLQYFLTSWHKQDAPGSSCIFCGLVLESAISEALCLLLFETGIRNQKLGARYVHCSWGIAPRPSQQTV